MAKCLRIEANFPVPVEIPKEQYQKLIDVLSEICKVYEEQNPRRIMWVFGMGSKVTYMPMTREEELSGKHIEFDDSVESFEIFERERYFPVPQDKWYLKDRVWLVSKGVCPDCGGNITMSQPDEDSETLAASCSTCGFVSVRTFRNKEESDNGERQGDNEDSGPQQRDSGVSG
jgi:hypothetical protein